MTPQKRLIEQDPQVNPNALHEYHTARRGPKNVPSHIMSTDGIKSVPKDPGHPYANTSHVYFKYFDQRTSNAPFGYEHFVSLPPTYDADSGREWPLVLFLHGAGESQRGKDESYASIRHGIPKVILCYDKLKSDKCSKTAPTINVPLAPRLRQSRQTKQGDKSVEPVDPEVCTALAENLITVTPSLNMDHGYGWNASILSALLDEIVERYHVDLNRIHVTGFSMGGYGTWDLGMQTPNRFATLIPICGGGDSIRAGLIQHIPQWCVS